MKISELLSQYAKQLDQVDVRLLLQHVLQVNAAFLIAHGEQILTPDQITHFEQLVARRIAGEPVAYLTGEKGFYDLVFSVSPAVLIPRPETELLVEIALSKIPLDTPFEILDLGTGSGIIAITLAKHRPASRVIAVDRSPDALTVARQNVMQLAIENVTFDQSDWYAGLQDKKFDMIVANPPYVAEEDVHLTQGDLRFEPQTALVAQENGLRDLSVIIRHAPAHLRSAGWLLFEHGYDQAAACQKMLQHAGFSRIFTAPDLAEIERVSGGQLLR